MTNLQEITNSAITELESSIGKKKLSKNKIKNHIYKIALKHVPITYADIINIALDNLSIAIQDPLPSPFKNENPISMMMSNIFWHIIGQLDDFINQLNMPDAK